MESLNINSKKGFTIIEVVLVLAIAGLIFLMVFIALPNMQSSQRNTSRRNDYSSLSTMVTSYVGNNNGKMPTTIKKTWMNANGKDPDGEDYTETTVVKCTSSACAAATLGTAATSMQRNKNQVFVYTAATCDGGTVKYKAGERNFVVWGYIENGANTGGTYCLASNA